MNSLEGIRQVIIITPEEFQVGPRRPGALSSIDRRALAPVFYLPGAIDRLAPVTTLPTALSEPVEPLDDVVELMVDTQNIPATVAYELMSKGMREEGRQLLEDCKALEDRGDDKTEIDTYAIEFARSLDAELREKAMTAVLVNQALLETIDIKAYALKRNRA